MFRRIASLVSCLLVFLAPGLFGNPTPLAEDPDYQNGLSALADQLPAVAATRFEQALANREEDDPDRAPIQKRLIEAYIRSGNVAAALPLLALPDLDADPIVIFWDANANVVLGNYDAAATSFALLADTEDDNLRRTATLNRARLLAGLGASKEALLLLEEMAATALAGAKDEATLLRASILLDTKLLDIAEPLLLEVAPESPRLRRQQAYLLARLALARERHEESAERFLALVDDPENLPRPLHFGAILGHADSLAALGRQDDAVEFLLSRIEKNTQSAQFEQFFARLVKWASESETLSEILQGKLVDWSAPGAAQGNPVLRGLDEPVATTLAWQWDSDTEPSELSLFSLFHHALFLAQKNDPESVDRAKRLLRRLRLEAPNHRLALESLLETALLHLGEGDREAALGCLDALESISDPGLRRAEAAELAARIRFADGDYAEAAAAFSRARLDLLSDTNRFTAINQGLAQLMSGDHDGFSKLLAGLNDDEAIESLELERAILLANKRDESAKLLLDEFLRNNPNHVRTAEARLALAELSLFTEPRDLSMALAQLDSINSASFTNRTALRYLLARLKLGELTGEWDAAIAEAGNYLRTRESPQNPAVLLKLGEAFFINGNYNEARIEFGQVIKIKEAAQHHGLARFYAAKAGLRVGTDEARQSALELLRQVSADNGPLAEEAHLQLARAHLDVAQPEPALEELSSMLHEDAGQPPRIDALLLAAEAHLAMGGSSHIDQCLEIYDNLLARKQIPYALSNRIHFLKGLALEKLGDPARAMDTYYRVINSENRPKDSPITEWKFFYDCGFRALSLLEDDKRWRSALAVARILAETGGYRAEEARLNAEDLQLKHMIWEDQ